MLKIQKRFILSALVSGIAFMLVYIVFDFYLLVSLLLSIVIYVGGVFLFRGKDMRLYDVQAISK